MQTNSGYRRLNFSKNNAEETKFTIIISGLGRSGTTMIAKMLSAIGISMGVPLDDVIHEDLEISQLIESGNEINLRKLAEKRNSSMNVWGFKRPLCIKKHSLIDRNLRNPRYIIIFRDPMAVSTRNSLALGMSVPDGLKVYHDQFKHIVDFVHSCSRPKLLISYEKMIQDPKPILLELANFCKIDARKIEIMRENVVPNNKEYILKTELDRPDQR